VPIVRKKPNIGWLPILIALLGGSLWLAWGIYRFQQTSTGGYHMYVTTRMVLVGLFVIALALGAAFRKWRARI